MKSYIVTAHHLNNDKSFDKTYRAYSCNHARFLFALEMQSRGNNVIIERLVGDPIYLAQVVNSNSTIVLDRIYCSE